MPPSMSVELCWSEVSTVFLCSILYFGAVQLLLFQCSAVLHCSSALVFSAQCSIQEFTVQFREAVFECEVFQSFTEVRTISVFHWRAKHSSIAGLPGITWGSRSGRLLTLSDATPMQWSSVMMMMVMLMMMMMMCVCVCVCVCVRVCVCACVRVCVLDRW